MRRILCFLLLLLLASCASPPSESTMVEEIPVAEEPVASDLLLGEPRQMKILGNEYLLELVSVSEGSATIKVNVQEFRLRVNEEFSFGDFIIRLDAVHAAGADITIIEHQ